MSAERRAPTTAGPHRRYDPLRDAWVLVSAGRDARPWRGQDEPAPVAPPAAYDPNCELCPGNRRAKGDRNPAYAGTYVFDNDFPALRPEAGALEAGSPADELPAIDRDALPQDDLNRSEAVAGVSRVLCFTPRHDLTLATMGSAERRGVVDAWAAQTAELGATYPWVQVFENRGAAMGASNPHPHGQVWASSGLPTEAAREDRTQREYRARTGRALLDDVREQEHNGPRVIEAAGSWLAVVPFWATWPFETLLIGPPGTTRLDGLEARDRGDLAEILGRLMGRYDALFDRPFPYSMGWHQAPFLGTGAGADPDAAHWRLHAHVYPPLLRADARKFMVGYELLAEPQRDLTPEDAAGRLRAAGG